MNLGRFKPDRRLTLVIVDAIACTSAIHLYPRADDAGAWARLLAEWTYITSSKSA